ncbi:MAG: hypothetical protein HOI23_20135 [Deltaproteobacteria bacterium]|nr:hypothetical protein [Deltaproteobacteria bacterium]MBT6434558.1 hypothetical protein [Deltaproteobacteria bacterium]MBT6490346.1 hypothetical protein [Deltaproteobacteria bacterium]
MQFIKTITLIASFAISLSACSVNQSDSDADVQLDVVGAITQSGALTSCGGFWGWLSNDCDEDLETQESRCLGLTNAPGNSFQGPGTWDAENRACVNKWPSPICYGMLMNSCSKTGTEATHQCSAWNPACRVMCSKWDGMRFGNYCSNDWWTANP